MIKLFINYSLIGILNTILGYFVIIYLTYQEVMPELSNLIGYLIGFSSSYFLNKKYNFKSQKKHSKTLPKFILSMTIAYLLNILALVFLYRFLNLNVYFSQICAGVIYIISGFLLSHFYTFNNKENNQ